MCLYTHPGGERIDVCVWVAKGHPERCAGPDYAEATGGFPSDEERALGPRCPCGRWPSRECAGECGVTVS